MKLKFLFRQLFSVEHRPVILILLSVFVVYINSVLNAYCVDDSLVILFNQYVAKGISGFSDIFTHGMFAGSYSSVPTDVFRYRPLSISSYALEFGLWGAQPHVSHLINTVLFAILAIKMYELLNYLVSEQLNLGVSGSYFSLLATLLFVVLPVHTEVVANIKGREEIFGLLFILLCSLSALKYSPNNSSKHLWLIGVWALLALLSKEHCIMLVVIVPAVLFVSGRGNKKAYQYTISCIAAAIVLYALLFINAKLNNKFAEQFHSNTVLADSFKDANFAQFVGTQLFIYWKYIQLLVFPLELTADYYPYHIKYVTLSVGSVAGFVSVGLTLWAILYYFKRNKLIVLALLIYLFPLAPVSNVFFPIGVFMSERFLFVPSLGYCIVVSYVFCWLINRYWDKRKYLLIVFSLILTLYGARTIIRNLDWKNDYTLFSHDIKISSNSIKCNQVLAKLLLGSVDTINDETRKQKVYNESLIYANRSLMLYPENAEVAAFKGIIYSAKDTSVDLVVYWVFRSLEISPDYKTYMSLFELIKAQKSMTKKIWIAEKMLKIRPDDYNVYNLLGVLYGKVHEENKGLQYLKQAIQLDPQRKEANLNMGIIYIRLKDYLMASKSLERSLQIDPSDTHALRNLAFAYEQLGEQEKAQRCYSYLNQFGY